MVINAQSILIILAVICFILSALREPYRFHLIATGLALFCASFLVS